MTFSKTINNKKSIFYDTFFFATILILCLTGSISQAEQRLQMDGTAIIGNKELPKVLYIVPWKTSETVALSTPPFNSVLDEEFVPVERSSFKRQVEFYNELYTSSDNKP